MHTKKCTTRTAVLIGGIYERDFVFFSVIFLLKFRKMGPRTKLPKSPRSLPPQPLVACGLERARKFSAPAGKYFFCSAQYKIPDLKHEYRYFINKYHTGLKWGSWPTRTSPNG